MAPLAEFPSAAFTFGCEVREDYRDRPLRQPRRRASTIVPSPNDFCPQHPVIEPAFPDPWPDVWQRSDFSFLWHLPLPRLSARCFPLRMGKQLLPFLAGQAPPR